MQYEDLLAKYIKHVVDCEGTDFIHRLNGGQGADVSFTDDEVRALQRLSSHKGNTPRECLPYYQNTGEHDLEKLRAAQKEMAQDVFNKTGQWVELR